MSSRRKSSVPCMVRYEPDLPEEPYDPNEATDLEKEQTISSDTPEHLENPNQQIPDPEPAKAEVGLDWELSGEPAASELKDSRVEEQEEEEAGSHKKQSRAYECKYCPFSTKNLKDFKEHVDSSHPNVILNPLYRCAACSFNTNKFDSLTEHNESQHPGQTNFKFKRIKVNNQTVLEQTIETKDISSDGQQVHSGGGDSAQSFALPAFVSATVKTPESLTPLYLASDLGGPLDHKDQITALNINGTVIIPEPSVLPGLSHVAPLLQRPPNFQSVPKVAVPLNTTKYNPSLDDNLTLMASFNKFPYPTHAELSWLTAASRHPEEQIKVWFTTQRLKQGITWSPEEVEEARKKMFNGSVPAVAHHTFSVLPTGSASQASAKPSQQPLLPTTVRHQNQARVSVPNGLSATLAATNSPIGTCLAPKRPHVTSVFGPESKRPIMAVAPHPGSSIDKVLMAPPPPPQKDRFPMAPPPAPMDMKRAVAVPLVSSEVKRSSTTVPLMPPPPPSLATPCLAPKGKISAATALGGQKTKPLVSLPSIVFPESLTRPMIAPPPIFAPPFKTSSLIPLNHSIVSKEKHPATDLKLSASSQLVAPQIRRPPIIQSIRAPIKMAAPFPAFPMDGKKPKEQQGSTEQKAEVNGTLRTDGKWPPDQNHLVHNNGVTHLDAAGGGGGSEAPAATKLDLQHKSSVLTQFPLLERMKGKTAEQLKVLEENFLRNSFPTQGEVDSLAVATRLSHQEIDSWFVERRALRDNLEQALLNSMGSKRMGPTSKKALLHQQQQHQQQTLQLNGIHKPSGGPHSLPILAPGAMAPPLANPAPCSVPADGRSLPLLKDDFAQMRWPSPEELAQSEVPTGPARADLARWFAGARLHAGAMELADLFHGNGVNGLPGPSLSSLDKAPASIVRHCQEGAFTNNGNNSKVLEVEFGWLMEQRGGSQQDKLLAGRYQTPDTVVAYLSIHYFSLNPNPNPNWNIPSQNHIVPFQAAPAQTAPFQNFNQTASNHTV